MSKMIKVLFLIFIVLFLIFVYYFFIAKAKKQEKITWGVNFSRMHSGNLKLDWKKNYLAILEDLGVKNIKLITNWNFIEDKKDKYYFDDVDWQIGQAKKYGAKLIYVVGMKTGRWPECHLPDWAKHLSKQEQQVQILEYIREVVLRYKSQESIIAWQAENEPLFRFGICPWYDKNFLKKEVELIKSIDQTRPVIISDSGEQSLWIEAAKIGDIVGTTMYRTVWVHITDKYGFYFTFPLPPVSYWTKAWFINKFFGKMVINVEIQAEPWVYDVFGDIPLREQEKTMNLDQFRKNIIYAKQTGFDQFYLWGAEWWYWMKETQNRPEIWEETKKLFSE